MIFGFFFFQAEDGIRDLVRSRGLGDVYKRQVFGEEALLEIALAEGLFRLLALLAGHDHRVTLVSVSYTHLTLPTSDLV